MALSRPPALGAVGARGDRLGRALGRAALARKPGADSEHADKQAGNVQIDAEFLPAKAGTQTEHFDRRKRVFARLAESFG